MGIIVYRKSNSEIMTEVIQYPLHDNEVFERFISQGGYSPDDFVKLEIPEELMPQAFQKKIVIVDGKITFGEDRNPIVQVPSETDQSVQDRLDESERQLTLMRQALDEVILGGGL